MKLKILLLIGTAVAGMGASYALADSGRGHHHAFFARTDGSCQRTHLLGTVAAPQTLTVTVARSGRHGAFKPGDVVTVSLGSSGQTIGVNVVGCVNGSSLTANGAQLQVVWKPNGNGQDGNGHHGGNGSSTSTSTGTVDAPTTSTDTTSSGDSNPPTDTSTTTE